MSDLVSNLIGRTLRSVRESRRQSQADIVELVAVAGICWDQTTVSRIESGHRAIKPREIAALVELMQLPVTAIILESHHCDSYEESA